MEVRYHTVVGILVYSDRRNNTVEPFAHRNNMWLRYLRYCTKYLRMVTVYTKCTRVSEYVFLRLRITSTGNRIVTDSESGNL
jgi:hypothetical protein